MKLVLFSVSNRNYGVNITQVREIIRVKTPVPIPDMPPWVEGIINIRGKVIPVIHLAKKIGLDVTDDNGLLNRVIIAHSPGRLFGIAVDFVTSVTKVPSTHLSPPDDILKEAGYISGIAKIEEELVPIMDMFAMLMDYDTTLVKTSEDDTQTNHNLNKLKTVETV